MKQNIAAKFQELYQTEGEFFASAGRINLIGEHTDYNGGFVFPGAIDKGMLAEIKLNGTDKVRAFAYDLNEYSEFGLNGRMLQLRLGQDISSVYAVRFRKGEA